MSKANGLLSRENCRRKYEEGLAQFAQPGNRDYMVTRGGFVNWGKAAGLSAEDIITDAHAAGVTNRDGSIRSAWESSTMRPDDGTAARTVQPKRAKKQPPPKAKDCFKVGALVGDEAEANKGCTEWVRVLSPLDVRHLSPSQQTAAFLRAILAPDQFAYMFREWTDERGDGHATPGKVGASVRRCKDWLRELERGGADVLDHVVPNPMSGRWEHTKGGKPSCACLESIATFPFLILEFDDMPLPWQFSFWRAFITVPHPLASRLVAIVHSGNKSLHGLLYVGCSTREQWNAARSIVAPLFDADTDKKKTPAEVLRFCADGQAMHPRQGVRLPGVGRCNERGEHTAAFQELLYLNPSANKSAPISAPCYIVTGELNTAYCGVCEHFNTCAHRNARAVYGSTILRKG